MDGTEEKLGYSEIVSVFAYQVLVSQERDHLQHREDEEPRENPVK